MSSHFLPGLWLLPGRDARTFCLWWFPVLLGRNPAPFHDRDADRASWLAHRLTVFARLQPRLPMGQPENTWAVRRDSHPRGWSSHWRHQAPPSAAWRDLEVPLPVASARWQLCSEFQKEQKSLQLLGCPALLCPRAFNSQHVTCGQRRGARTLEWRQKIIPQVMSTLAFNLTPWTRIRSFGVL